MKVLIVDDEPEILNILEEVIEEKFMCEVERAENGLDAFLLCRDHKYNCIITDYKMPYMSGAALIMALQTRANLNKDTNCIMLSAFVEDALKEKWDLGHVQFLNKPMDINLICEKLSPHLN